MSTGFGIPVATLQSPQDRVRIFPKIINVAVPAPQHSPIFGQFPLSQIVCNLCEATIWRTCAYSFPVGSLTLSQSGLRIIFRSVVNSIFLSDILNNQSKNLKPFLTPNKFDI